MKRWRIVAAAGLLAAFLSVPVQAAEWCMKDPALTIQTPSGDSFTVYVTEGVMGSQHVAALASAKVGYVIRAGGKDRAYNQAGSDAAKQGYVVAVFDYIPTDSSGAFATQMIVSSQPFGAGIVYGTATGTSGVAMIVMFRINSGKGSG